MYNSKEKNMDQKFEKFRKKYVVTKKHKKHCAEHWEVYHALFDSIDKHEQELLDKLMDMHITHCEAYAKSAVKFFLANK